MLNKYRLAIALVANVTALSELCPTSPPGRHHGFCTSPGRPPPVGPHSTVGKAGLGSA
jgi:hypothetical protein